MPLLVLPFPILYILYIPVERRCGGRMNAAIARLRPFVPPVAWMCAALVSCGVLHALTGLGLVGAARGVAAVAGVVMMMSLVVPAVSLSRASELSGSWLDDLRRWGATVGGALGGLLLGLLVYTLVTAARAAPAVLASIVVIAACALSFAALARALTRLLARFRGGRLAGAGAAGGLLLALAAVPFWTGGLIRSHFAWGPWLVGASPFLASAMPWTVAGGPWGFDPRTSPVLYGIWVGTDVPLVMPGWIACAAGHLIFALVVIALAEVMPRVMANRGLNRG